jgi:hypothetical protein
VKENKTMANPNPKRSNLKPFVKGRSGNPTGKPVGARNRIQGDFIRAVADDFEQHGQDAIQRCRLEKPDVYLRVIASLMPRNLQESQLLDGLTDAELEAGIAALKLHLVTEADH